VVVGNELEGIPLNLEVMLLLVTSLEAGRCFGAGSLWPVDAVSLGIVVLLVLPSLALDSA
jgi:hypothetical protein